MLFTLFKHFFLLGWISFGGPAAHIGYFHQKFVQQLAWVTQEKYGQIVALSQFLPGPGSSQVGFALGYQKAGLSGAITAFVAFTTPSVLLMLALAQINQQLSHSSYFYGIVHGLKLLAVVVVTDAVLSMFHSFCKSTLTRFIALAATVALLLSMNIHTQIIVLIIAAIIGVKYLTPQDLKTKNQGVVISWWPIVMFVALFCLFAIMASQNGHWRIASDFYHAGSLVFGGGHVVLPLLQNLLSEQLSTDTFLTGYAAAQAIPGPMFTLATFLGFTLSAETPYLTAIIATICIFLPGFLLMLAFLKHWHTLANMPRLSGALQGINAAVVGLLLSALYMPIFVSAVLETRDMALVLVGFYLLKQMKTPILWLVLGFSLAGVLMAMR